jgi:hypothetical protein
LAITGSSSTMMPRYSKKSRAALRAARFKNKQLQKQKG